MVQASKMYSQASIMYSHFVSMIHKPGFWSSFRMANIISFNYRLLNSLDFKGLVSRSLLNFKYCCKKCFDIKKVKLILWEKHLNYRNPTKYNLSKKYFTKNKICQILFYSKYYNLSKMNQQRLARINPCSTGYFKFRVRRGGL